jgi:hypothetical protein
MLAREFGHTGHTMWLAVLLAAQLHVNATPQPRELGAFYFNGLEESQVWVDVAPPPAGDGDSPVRINVTIKFRGHELRGTPKTATIRASSNIFVAPLHVTIPVLKFHLADDTVIDLTAPGAVYAFTSNCDNCAADTIVVDLPFTDVERMTASAVILVEALGCELRLSPEDMAAIRKLVEAVRDGVTVK